jgi:selenocysteine-specific elongation factor
MTNLNNKKLDQLIQNLLSRQNILLIDREQRVYMHQKMFQQLKQELLDHLTHYHSKHPLKAGMPKEELKTKIPRALRNKLFTLLVTQMTQQDDIVVEGDMVRLFAHRIALGADQEDIRDRILAAYRENALQPPYFKELSKTLNTDAARAKDVLMLLVEEGRLVKVKEDLFFDTEAIDNLRDRLIHYLQENGEISTPQFKEMTGATRKYVIPLIEYFDAQNVTIRIGDIRKLRKSG